MLRGFRLYALSLVGLLLALPLVSGCAGSALSVATRTPTPPPTPTATPSATAARLTPVTFRSGEQQVISLVASADGKTLLGQTSKVGNPPPPAVPLVASTDGGVTWHALPPFPAAQGCCYPVWVAGAPDGTVLAEVSVYTAGQGSFAQTGVFALRPGASGWVYVASPPEGTIIGAASYDAAGRPIALWAPGFGSGLGYHPLA